MLTARWQCVREDDSAIDGLVQKLAHQAPLVPAPSRGSVARHARYDRAVAHGLRCVVPEILEAVVAVLRGPVRGPLAGDDEGCCSSLPDEARLAVLVLNHTWALAEGVVQLLHLASSLPDGEAGVLLGRTTSDDRRGSSPSSSRRYGMAHSICP